MNEPHDLELFVRAQSGVYKTALVELRAGSKRSHWMWFVFPQIAGLGSSEMARRYAIASLAEAEAYLAHPVLGARLVECVEAMLSHPDSSATAILGGIDAVKLRSSMTLFSRAADDPALYDRCLATFFGGEPDPATLERCSLPTSAEQRGGGPGPAPCGRRDRAPVRNPRRRLPPCCGWPG